MLSAVNVPQSKTVSIAFVSLKSMIFGIITAVTFQQIASDSSLQECTNQMQSFTKAMQILSILALIIDTIALAYFFFQKQFRKLQYYIFYIFHIIIGLIAIIGGITNNINSSGCGIGHAFLNSVIASAVVLQVNILIAMNQHLYFILKYLHFGSNLTWTYLWFRSYECDKLAMALVATIHLIMSFFNILSLIGLKIYGKTSGIISIWKKLTIISFFMMILCYLIVLIGVVSSYSCPEMNFLQTVYQKYGVFQIISPLLIILFLRGQSGDPRQNTIKNHDQVFTKLYQNENADFSQKI